MLALDMTAQKAATNTSCLHVLTITSLLVMLILLLLLVVVSFAVVLIHKHKLVLCNALTVGGCCVGWYCSE